ncbi:hypothetical protein KIPB_014319, partial [Kipferlia bialata]
FMVVDAGGGTVDLTVHKVNDEGCMEEVTRGHGDSCGATFLDVQFLEWLRERLGDEFFYECQAKYPAAMASLLESWEKTKRSFTGDGEPVYIHLPGKIGRHLPDEVEERLEDLQDGEGDELVLSTKDFKTIFDPVVTKVLNCVVEQFRRLKREGGLGGDLRVDVMLLVGGFNESPYLVSRIRDKFRDYAGHIIAPMHP